jgi:hypothetical protein
MATLDQLAEAQRVEQARVSAEAARAALVLWLSTYQPGDSQRWRTLIAAFRALLTGFRGRSSRSAVAYYMVARGVARVPGLHVPTMAPDARPDLVEATLQIAGARAYGRSLSSGMTVEQARRNAGVQLAGAASRIALDAGRQTILGAVDEDPEAIGWARITDKDPCAFCSMLASRGPSYLSEETASFKAHSHCACIAAPVFSRDEAWLGHSKDLYEQWKRETAGESGKDALRVWRRYWDNRDKPEGGRRGSVPSRQAVAAGRPGQGHADA